MKTRKEKMNLEIYSVRNHFNVKIDLFYFLTIILSIHLPNLNSKGSQTFRCNLHFIQDPENNFTQPLVISNSNKLFFPVEDIYLLSYLIFQLKL